MKARVRSPIVSGRSNRGRPPRRCPSLIDAEASRQTERSKLRRATRYPADKTTRLVLQVFHGVSLHNGYIPYSSVFRASFPIDVLVCQARPGRVPGSSTNLVSRDSDESRDSMNK